jgi:hypothetical protein
MSDVTTRLYFAHPSYGSHVAVKVLTFWKNAFVIVGSFRGLAGWSSWIGDRLLFPHILTLLLGGIRNAKYLRSIGPKVAWAERK